MESPQFFENRADYADQRSLLPYEGEKDFWLLITDKNLSLGEVCYAFYIGMPEKITEWIDTKKIILKKSFRDISKTENGWMVVAFEDIYFLKPYEDKE